MKIYSPFKNTKAEEFIDMVRFQRRMEKIASRKKFISPWCVMLINTKAIDMICSLREPVIRQRICSILAC